MRKLVLVLVAVFLLGSLPTFAEPDSASDKILEFDTMVGVRAPFLRGQGNPIRGVDGGGVPWSLTRITGELKVNGRLEIDVRGLVVTSSGVNPSPVFRAIVSCITVDAAGNKVDPHNITTAAFPATAAGDAKIETIVALPTPCIAPIIFVTSNTGSWFAVTGF